MTATVHSFTRQARRAWLIIEVEPGVWSGQLMGADGAIQAVTSITGEEWRVEMCVNDNRQGLPVVRLPLQADGGGAAA